jgi:hypothetical protein
MHVPMRIYNEIYRWFVYKAKEGRHIRIINIYSISGQNVQHLNVVNCIAGVYFIKTNTCVHKKCLKK